MRARAPRARPRRASSRARAGVRQVRRGALHHLLVRAVEPEQHEPGERRIAEDATALQLARHEPRVVVVRGGDQARMLGRSVCTSDAARRVAAAGAAGHLHEQLERALGGAEVGDIERQVREHYDRPA